ncbi:MAG: excinuclease ABC subunit UvrB [Verrucomicrobiota bacterium]|nr:excinuclease ABC subunit UvrB [Verrucomicrobiota bacterium]
MKKFKLHSKFSPAGDQKQAIDRLTKAFSIPAEGNMQTLQGITGSGKTYTLAKMIEKINRPILVMSHNKTLAAQLYSEFKSFFPENAVEFFISYYDYYLPEAYMPQTDTYIAKDASINDEIEKLRLSATSALCTRQDVIVIASVSCIYGLGSPGEYEAMVIRIEKNTQLDRDAVLQKLIDIQYERNDFEIQRGGFSVIGDTIEIYPAYSEDCIRIEFWGDLIEKITMRDPLTKKKIEDLEDIIIFPAKHFVLPQSHIDRAIPYILEEMKDQVRKFEKEDKLIEAQRIFQRTNYDIEMLREIGYCSGIENYSMHLSERTPGSRPYTLIDFFPDDFITIIDESHMTLPQIRGMFKADRSRKQTLVNFGFRLPSALDNRPLNFDEFSKLTNDIVYVSATPGLHEIENTKPILQEIRPTGLLDPKIEIRPLSNQIDDLIDEIRRVTEKKQRVLVTTLTKRTAEDLADYLRDIKIRVKYIHSEIDALERVELLRGLRSGEFDVLIGVNLLREGLDLPEVALVAILDADKEGFLRSERALTQTAGRAARNKNGRVILYANKLTDSIKKVVEITETRRKHQKEFNKKHNITPQTVKRAVQQSLHFYQQGKALERSVVAENEEDYDVTMVIGNLNKEMQDAAENLEFERAAMLRDQILTLEGDDEKIKHYKIQTSQKK